VNAATRRRRGLAEQIAHACDSDGVAAIVLGGSAGRGEADEYSDIDLLAFWRRPPTEDERVRWIAAAGGEIHRLMWIDDELLWFDDWKIGPRGLAVESVHMTLEDADGRIADIVTRFDTDLAKHVVLGQIVHGTTLVGDLSTQRQRLRAYPDGLARAMIARHAQIDHFWRFPMFRARANPVHQAAATADLHERILHALLAVNRVYFFGFKSLDAVVRRLQTAPHDLPFRIRATYEADAVEAEQMLAELTEETYDLVAAHVPDSNVERLREIFRYRRGTG
jgi:hypothetical protein